ncbi:MAG: HEAT repeat domain-containing protein [Methanothrix sp.]|nr:HEAT repeat domain-containing protein [Methanothrix sp.]
MRDSRPALERVVLDKSVDHRLRSKAVRTLGQIEDPRSEGVLLKALMDEYPAVRLEAVSALAEMGGTEARAALEKMLNSKSARLRSDAARALIKISGVPDAKQDNLELLFELLSSKDRRIESAILKMGDPALDFLSGKLNDACPTISQHAARTLAYHIRRTLNILPQGQEALSWLAQHDITPQAISDLYRFSIIRKGVFINQVTNTGFDEISKVLCGDEKIRFAQKISLIEYSNAYVRRVDLNALLAEYGADQLCADQLQRMGRTLIAPIENGFLALKLCVHYGDLKKLFFEAQMQKYLMGMALSSALPLPLEGIFKIEGLSPHLLEDLTLKDHYAIGYIADPGYFTYLNNTRLTLQDLRTGLCTCAGDLARLTRTGLIHASLIPLFHKKRNENRDYTEYCWHRKIAGRLERWLESCKYPNLRLSGIADFEHIEIYREISPEKLQSHIGGHLLSMSLVLACYFRYKGQFDQNAMKSIIRDCFCEYYCAITKKPQRLDEVIDWDALALRMVEEMESDGCTSDDETDPGGPHLGIRWGPFPIPELIRAIHIISVFSVMQMQQGLRALGKDDGRIDCIPLADPSHNTS